MNDPSKWIDILLKIGPFFISGLQWIKNRIKWGGISEDARKIAFAIHSYSRTNLQQKAPVINRVGLINRPEIEQIWSIWQSADIPILLHGAAGSGKSGIVLHLGQALADEGIPVLFLRATDFSIYQDPLVVIQNRMALNIPLMDALAKLSKERPCSVIVDQLDSVAGTDLGKNLVSFLKALIGLPNIKVLAVSRSYELLNDPDISTLEFQKIESGKLTEKQTLGYLSLLGISAPSQIVVELASNLLNLSLISEVITISSNYQIAIENEVELWKQFFATIGKREGEEVADFVLQLSRKETIEGKQNFPIQFPNFGIRRKLLSRGIIIESPGRRFSFRHEQLQNFLCAYSLLPEKPTLLLLLGEFGNNIHKGVLSWLHQLYHTEFPEEEPILVDNILGARDNPPIYTRILILENLKQQKDPTVATARIIAKHSNEWAYQRYFFEGLENPNWIDPLYRIDFFHKAPDPIEVQPGSFQLPGWPAGVYLARFADRYEEIVIDVVRSIKTENWRVQEILVDALMKIRPAAAASLVSSIDAWLSGRFSDMLPNKLVPLADHLRETGFVDAAIQILESVITPVLPPIASEYSKYRSPVRFRSDHYWVNEYCEKQLLKLMPLNPVDIVLAFQRQLEKTIELTKQANVDDAELQVGYYWRLDIPNRISETSDADALDILIDGLRNGLAELCKQAVDEGRKFLTNYLSSEHLIFQRIALFTLRTYGQNSPELVNQGLLQRNYLESSEYVNEYRGLLRDQFASASEEVREEVINWILAGPSDVDSRAIRRAKWENREVTDNDRREIREGWTLYHLEIIREYLKGETLERLNELASLHGKPDIEERPHMVTTSWGGAPSPVPADEFAKKSFDEIKQLFMTYDPEDLFLNPRESLAQTFQGLVREDPTRYSDFADFLTDPAIRLVYVHHYLSGIHDGIKNKTGRLEDAVISLCEYVVSLKEDTFEGSPGRNEPGLFAAQMEVARLLEEALHSDDPYLTKKQLDRIRALLISLVHHANPEPGDDAKNSFDPFTQSLNCVRGQAMHGIIHYSLYLILNFTPFIRHRVKGNFDIWSRIQPVINTLRLNAA